MKSTFSTLLLTLLCWLGSARLWAQCLPVESCQEINCVFPKLVLEGETWQTATFAPNELPTGGFCSMIQNDQWFAFRASDTLVKITILPSECTNGNGVQGAIYPDDCSQAPLACIAGCAGCGAEPFTLEFSADSGHVYYLVIDGFSGDWCNFTITTQGVSDDITDLDYRVIEGRAFWDVNQNCTVDNGDIPAQGLKVDYEGSTLRTIPTGLDGTFKFVRPYEGAVAISLPPLQNSYWEPCQSSFLVDPPLYPDVAKVDFLLRPTVLCPYMDVQIGLPPFFRPCAPTVLTAAYCNLGTMSAENSYLDIALPEGMLVDSASLPISAQIGDTLRFQLGTVDPLECGNLKVYVRPKCSQLVIGQTLCVAAHIYPDSLCPDPEAAFIQVAARCVGDSTVRFTLRNTGQLPTSQSLEYIIIEDEVVLHKGLFQLPSGDSMAIEKKANGATWRIEAQQDPSYAGASRPALSIEGCQSLQSPGLINAFPLDDAEPFIDIECRQVRISYDPNIKLASPEGVGNTHLIEKNTPIEYSLHFQNTGNDTAFLIRLVDTLPVQAMDILSFRPGASSHPCTWQIMDQRVLEVVFNPITLPDSNVNEGASHGWFEYTMQQLPNLPNGTRIANRVAIFFDFNPPVLTETAWHTVGRLTVSIDDPISSDGLRWQVLGNPNSTHCLLQAASPVRGRSRFTLADAMGRIVQVAEFGGEQLRIERGRLDAGMYFFHIQTEEQGTASGKLLLQD
ncbi:MAG TPA: T9SS type A sorting domain-containing protein [Saprospiraceae bacterium]|nr:T9SS type A sorting domain-containing protein [Saprospiraceae bacterium]